MIAGATQYERRQRATDRSLRGTRVCARINRAKTAEFYAGAFEDRNLRHERDRFGAHPLWRRVTGLTFAQERNVSPKERRAGLRRLVEWMRRNADSVSPQRRGGAEDGGNGERGADQTWDADPVGERDVQLAPDRVPPICGRSQIGAAAGTGLRTAADPWHPRNGNLTPGPFPRREGGTAGVSFARKWDLDVADWARTGAAGVALERICMLLQISLARLSALTREYCGVSARELLDGFKLERLRGALRERFRLAAHALWGEPGDYALEKIGPHGMELRTTKFTAETQGRRERQYGHSRYFPAHARGVFDEDEIAERERRVTELLTRFRAQCERDRFAAELGFDSVGRLSRACLNVLGHSLRGVERMLAAEVVRYYICAEDKRVRELACGADGALSFAARELYGNSEARPQEPFADRWAAAEKLARDWLEAMAGAFG